MPLTILQLYPCSSEAQRQWWASWTVKPSEWDMKAQTALCSHIQLWKLWDYWENSCWYCLDLKCVSVFMDLYLAANDCANGYAKKSPFASWLLKWHEPCPSVLYRCWNSTHTASFLHSPALPVTTSETLHLSPTLFPTASFIVFPLAPAFQFCGTSPRTTHKILHLWALHKWHKTFQVR